MDGVRLGSVLRAVRVRHRWRQADVAARAGLSAATVSRVERGRMDGVAVGSVMRVAAALDVRVDWTPRWRGGELDRMLNAGHAAMHEAIAAELAGSAWELAPEVSFSIYGERGVIDVLARHAQTGMLLVIELKTELVDVQGLIGAVDRYRRLAPVIARERGWVTRAASSWVILRDTASNHRRLAAHATVLRRSFPQDGRRMRAWLRRPDEPVSALSFLSDSRRWNGIAASTGVQRVRIRRPSVESPGQPRIRSREDR